MANEIVEQFSSENGVSPDERGTSTQPFVIAQAAPVGPKQNPWSKYVPFAKGAELLVEGRVSLIPLVPIPFSGSGTIKELTEAQLDFSVTIPVELPAFLNVPKGVVSIVAKITYAAEGSSNKAVFSINGREREKTINIQSKRDERILTPPGGLEIPTGAPSPFPEKVTIKVVHMRPTKDGVEIEVEMAFPIPTFTIRASKKQSASGRIPT